MPAKRIVTEKNFQLVHDMKKACPKLKNNEIALRLFGGGYTEKILSAGTISKILTSETQNDYAYNRDKCKKKNDEESTKNAIESSTVSEIITAIKKTNDLIVENNLLLKSLLRVWTGSEKNKEDEF